MCYSMPEKRKEGEKYCSYCGALLRDRPAIMCLKCRTLNDTDSIYCKHCAAPLPNLKICANCGAKNDRDSLFCKMCGTKLGKSGGAPEQISLPEYRNCQVGEHFEFGKYSYASAGKPAPIEWRVLRRGYNRMLVVSLYGLDSRQYNEEPEGVTWESCSLRKWLNNNFISSAFNEKEQECIMTTTLSNEDNHEYDTPAGNSTTDQVFLLSLKEAVSLFRDDDDRRCMPTPYAVANGAWQFDTDKDEERNLKGYGWWWLRSPGNNPCSACDIDYDGNIDSIGISVELGFGCVRPAMVLKL